MKLQIHPTEQFAYDLVEKTLGKENTFLVGGYVRDSLLGRKSHDLDFATPLKPESFFSLFPAKHYSTKYGTLSFAYGNIHITIASFRKEGDYLDHRHPSSITFIPSLEEDSKRRDLTINALYRNSDGTILDPTESGLKDLRAKTIRIIGAPSLRLEEDPLRIIRTYRFALELGFVIEPETLSALKEKNYLLKELKKEKILEEIHKCPEEERKNLRSLLNIQD